MTKELIPEYVRLNRKMVVSYCYLERKIFVLKHLKLEYLFFFMNTQYEYQISFITVTLSQKRHFFLKCSNLFSGSIVAMYQRVEFT